MFSLAVLSAVAAVNAAVEAGNAASTFAALENEHACLANLDRLPATGAVLVAAPLKIRNGTGSPLRVLALVEKSQ